MKICRKAFKTITFRWPKWISGVPWMLPFQPTSLPPRLRRFGQTKWTGSPTFSEYPFAVNHGWSCAFASDCFMVMLPWEKYWKNTNKCGRKHFLLRIISCSKENCVVRWKQLGALVGRWRCSQYFWPSLSGRLYFLESWRSGKRRKSVHALWGGGARGCLTRLGCLGHQCGHSWCCRRAQTTRKECGCLSFKTWVWILVLLVCWS